MKQTVAKVSRGLTLAFDLGIIAQATLGVAQFFSGVALLFAPTGAILKIVDWLSRNEIVQDPQDQTVSLLQHWASHLSTRAEGFYSVYLVGHGVLNVFVALALFRHWPGSYPLSMVVLSAFMVFQLWEYTHTFDPMLLVLTLIDVVVIVIITLERRQRLRLPTPKIAP